MTPSLDLVELLRECKRRMEHAAGSNSDDWRWYQNQARQTLRALGPKIDAVLSPGSFGAMLAQGASKVTFPEPADAPEGAGNPTSEGEAIR